MQLAQYLPLVVIALAFWFLLIRPARKRQRDMAHVQSSLDAGTQVMLGSGIYGTVASTGDETVQLEISPGTTVTVARQAVVRIIDEPDPADDGSAPEGVERSEYGSDADQ